MEKRKPGRPSTNDLRRNEILEKAAKCFVQFGYNRSKLDDIGELIGLNKAALYYYFKNKEEIFIEVFKAEVQRRLFELRQKNGTILDDKAKILHYFYNRTDVFISLMDMLSLSKDNVIALITTFNENFKPYIVNEMNYIGTILNNLYPKLDSKVCQDYVEMLFQVNSSLTFMDVISKNLRNNSELLLILKDKKNIILNQLLISFKE